MDKKYPDDKLIKYFLLYAIAEWYFILPVCVCSYMYL